MSSGESLTDVEYWRGVWERIGEREPHVAADYTFDPVLSRYLPVREDFDAVEIGCFPGTYMLYMAERFRYRVSGIDFVPELGAIRAPLERAGARVATLLQGNFLELETDLRFDVVGSFGFVEHFENLERLLDLHAKLLKPGGWLVVEVPHFRGVHRLLRSALEPELLAAHNLDAMVPRRYRAWLDRRGFDVWYCDYYRTFDFWLSSSAPLLQSSLAPKHRAAVWGARALKSALRATRLEDVPNRWLSPYVVVVARAPG